MTRWPVAPSKTNTAGPPPGPAPVMTSGTPLGVRGPGRRPLDGDGRGRQGVAGTPDDLDGHGRDDRGRLLAVGAAQVERLVRVVREEVAEDAVARRRRLDRNRVGQDQAE